MAIRPPLTRVGILFRLADRSFGGNPMPISWNEIRQNAIRFAADWAGARSESAEKQTFWNEFFEVFGMRRRVVASFEEPVKQIYRQRTAGSICSGEGCCWSSTRAAATISARPSPRRSSTSRTCFSEGRQDDVPRYVIVSDFARFALYDLEPEDQRPLPLFAGLRVETTEFRWPTCTAIFTQFAFIAGYQQHRFRGPGPDQPQSRRHHGRPARRPGGRRLHGPRS